MNSLNPDLGHWQRLLPTLRRRAWIVIPCIVIAGALAFAKAKSETPSYTATASLLFQQDELSQQLFGYSTTSITSPTEQGATNVQLVREPVVAADTARALHISRERVANAITVEEVGSSDVVNLAATDHSPTLAARITNTYAQKFIAYRESAQRAQISSASRQLETQIAQLQASHHTSKLGNLQTRLSQLQVLRSLQTGDVQQVQTAGVPTGPSGPSIKKDTALGIILGLIIGLLAAIIAERMDQTLRDPDEVRNLLSLPVLGTIPATRDLSRSESAKDFSANRNAEPFRLLRSQLRYFNVDRRIRSILISSAAPGDGKSTVAWNLARAAAVAEGSVLLVDADLRAPTIGQLAGIPPGPGLAEVLTQQLEPESVMHHVELISGEPDGPVLDVLLPGYGVPNPSELMESHALRDLVERLEQRYDLIIFDAPPTLVVSDAIPLMTQVSGILIVSRLRQTRRAALRKLREQIGSFGDVHVLGIVVNGAKARSVSYYSYGYGYGNGNGRATADDPAKVLTGAAAGQAPSPSDPSAASGNGANGSARDAGHV